MQATLITNLDKQTRLVNRILVLTSIQLTQARKCKFNAILGRK